MDDKLNRARGTVVGGNQGSSSFEKRGAWWWDGDECPSKRVTAFYQIDSVEAIRQAYETLKDFQILRRCFLNDYRVENRL